MKISKKKTLIGLPIRELVKRIISLGSSTIFWVLTIGGNAFIFLGALFMQLLEAPINPHAEHYMDCLIWSVGIVSTVGSSSLYPITFLGKLLMILMMMGGALFLWAYMALFIGAMVGPELRKIENEVSELQKSSKQEDEVLEKVKEFLNQSKSKNSL